MFLKIKLALQLIGNMGLRYTRFRIAFELKKRLGIFKTYFPVNPAVKKFKSFQSWKDNTKFLIPDRESWKTKEYQFSVNRLQTEKMKNGIFEFFSSTEFNLGKDYDWMTNPDTGFKYDAMKHWTDINDYDSKAGDIKYVWEKSRFSFVYAFIREDIAHGTDNGAFVLNEIRSWIKANSINLGPNYKCSQEASLRVINWTFVLHFYRNSPQLTEELFDEIMHNIYWQIKHVRSNINFSRIAVRNNHAITETLMLYIGGLIYSFFPEAQEWKSSGKKWFEQEIAYQVYPDGTFLQFSMNYHRVLIQLFNLAFIISNKYQERFGEVVYKRSYESLNFLFQCQIPQNGMLPNYGANDGAIFFPLTSCEYRDFRPSLNLLHIHLTGKNLYDEGAWMEESVFYEPSPVRSYPILIQNEGWSSFDSGGYYVLRDQSTLTFIRCGNHKDRPSQADNLHLDIWVDGKNVLFDGGSYKYNTDKDILRYFMGTSSHNTIMLDNNDQMLKGGRFIWYNWTQRINSLTNSTSDEYSFEGSIGAFKYIDKRIQHIRNITKLKGENTWIVRDKVVNKPNNTLMRQLFHINNNQVPLIQFSSDPQNVSVIKEAWYSGKYGFKESISQQEFQTKRDSIETIIHIKY
jgi:hypothetical protein